MNKFWQIVVTIVLILIVFILYWTRYQIVTANYAYAPAFYKINRLLGEVTLTVGKEFVVVEGVEAKRLEGPGPAVPRQTPVPVPAPGPAPAPAPAPPSSK